MPIQKEPRWPGNIKPFLKWAGGKTQLLPVIGEAFPEKFKAGQPFSYIEPFVGSGAVLFWVLKTFPQVKKAVINDVNSDLTGAYQTIKENPLELIAILEALQQAYFEKKEEARKDFFLEKRERFNQRNLNLLENTALLLFLNRTCFNGLYRVNSQNKFNVPFGKYKQPAISNPTLIKAVSATLQKVDILNGDFEQTLHSADRETFFYFDPPYKPISQTASFTAYAQGAFDDQSQRRLKAFCDKLDALGHSWLLSNSDPKNVDLTNSFFDDLYQSYCIKRVRARRAINSNAGKRGEISELLISNYSVS
ncbi:MAG: DNA adenine methylase [Lewinellaceae bacterium]|nr:DNA adenine methylase [Saprospiraceae bacterium]MCB9339982.1 DNA adenine methylase [Lewinellaceae bacterium]